MTAFAIVLFLCAVAGSIAAGTAGPRERAYLRLAAMLMASMAVSEVLNFAAEEVTAIVATLTASVLALAALGPLRRPLHPASEAGLLVVALISGIAAAATGKATFSAVPQVLAALAIILLARRIPHGRARLVLGALCLGGSAVCQLGEGLPSRAGVLLFSAAALMGVSTASGGGIDERRQQKTLSAVRRAG